MISLRRIFGLMLLFFFFEAVVAVVTTVVWPDTSVFLACLAMTALAAGVWAVFVLLTRVMMRPRTPQPVPQSRPVAPTPARKFGDDIFSEQISTLIREADRRLAGTASPTGQREQPTVATLPLFFVIGAEGAGKTAAIMNSGLEPRLLAGEAAREGAAVPTRVCNLWFAGESVFADMSGRIMDEGDNWERALRVLGTQQSVPTWKRLLLGRRGQQNLRGIVVVCDTNTVVQANDPQRTSAFARKLNERLLTAGEVFGKDFPVYVIFSKADGIQYFPEFFSRLSDPESRRLLGATLPLVKFRNDSAEVYADTEGKRLTNFFNRLYMSLGSKRLIYLAREDESRKKSVAYEFPRELKKIRGDIVQFLLDVFRPNPLQHGPRLRGFYFSGLRWIARSGGIGEVLNMDFSIAPKRSDATVFFGAKQPAQAGPRPVGTGAGTVPRWMFLTEVFNNVILRDRAGNTAAPVNTRDQVYRALAFGAGGAVFLLVTLIWANSWRNNRALLNSTLAAVEATQTVANNAVNQQSLSELDRLRTVLVPLQTYARQGAPLSYRWGLYAGGAAYSAVNRLYFDRFRMLFLAPILDTMTGHFLSLHSDMAVQDDIYSLLKAYRMMTSGACQPNEEFLNTTLTGVWSSLLPDNQDLSAIAEKQLQFYTSELKTENPYQTQVSEDRKAVAQAQGYLHDLNGPDKIFHALVEQVNHDKQGDALTQYAANYSEVMSGPNTMEAAYTRQGWDTMMDQISGHKLASAGEACVVGTDSGVAKWKTDVATEGEVEDLYVKSYIQHWKAFLAAHQVSQFSGTADAARRLQILADNNRSPLLALVYMTSHNTAVTSPRTVSSTVDEIKTGAKQQFGNLLQRIENKKQDPSTQPVQNLVGDGRVREEFAPVYAVTDPANQDQWLNAKNQEYIKSLADLGTALAAVPARIDPAAPNDQQAVDQAKKAAANASAALHNLAGSFPNTDAGVDVDLKNLLEEPILYASRTIAGVPLKPPPPDPNIPIRAQVNHGAQALCASLEEVRSKYPFNLSSQTEASIQDLNDLFAPATGRVAQFTQLPAVSKVLLRQGKTWAPNPGFPSTVSEPFLLALNNLSDVSDSLYGGDERNPHTEYMVSLDGTGHLPFELDVDGHVIKYNPGKTSVPVKLVWPPVTNAPTRLVLKTGLTLPVQESGPWSLFHLLQAADDQRDNLFTFRTIQFAGSGHVPLQDGKGNPVTLQVRIESQAGNIFSKSYFSRLRCETLWAVK